MPEETPAAAAPGSEPVSACPDTKAALDACIKENGEVNCAELLEAHMKCMKDLGLWCLSQIGLICLLKMSIKLTSIRSVVSLYLYKWKYLK